MVTENDWLNVCDNLLGIRRRVLKGIQQSQLWTFFTFVFCVKRQGVSCGTITAEAAIAFAPSPVCAATLSVLAGVIVGSPNWAVVRFVDLFGYGDVLFIQTDKVLLVLLFHSLSFPPVRGQRTTQKGLRREAHRPCSLKMGAKGQGYSSSPTSHLWWLCWTICVSFALIANQALNVFLFDKWKIGV